MAVHFLSHSEINMTQVLMYYVVMFRATFKNRLQKVGSDSGLKGACHAVMFPVSCTLNLSRKLFKFENFLRITVSEGCPEILEHIWITRPCVAGNLGLQGHSLNVSYDAKNAISNLFCELNCDFEMNKPA
jgi:hypothetical protein